MLDNQVYLYLTLHNHFQQIKYLKCQNLCEHAFFLNCSKVKLSQRIVKIPRLKFQSQQIEQDLKYTFATSSDELDSLNLLISDIRFIQKAC